MSRLTQTLMAGTAAVLLAGAGLAASAQAPAPQGKPQAQAERHERMAMRRADRAKDKAQHLRNILQLRPNQEAALTAYLASRKMDHEGMMKMGGDGPPPKTTPERLARMEQQMAMHQAQMKARLDATRTFYAQLDASQKKAFDELPMMMMGGHGGQRMHAMKGAHRGGAMRGMPPMQGAPLPPTPPAPNR